MIEYSSGHCRACGERALQTVLDLGSVPAADNFPPADSTAQDELHPLAMGLCAHCGLAQLVDDDTVADEPRGVEPLALRRQAVDAIEQVTRDGWLVGGGVREFGSPHGGSWLPLLEKAGLEPVDEEQPADVVVDCFGIMHEPAQRDAFAGRAAALTADGVLLVQFHSLVSIVRGRQWNALRHGHFAYYSLTSLTWLLRESGLVPRQAWTFDLYGGTVLVAATRTGEPDTTVTEILEQEARLGVGEAQYVRILQDAADFDADDLREGLAALRANGAKVHAYGAASRAVALLGRARIDRALLNAVADASPGKQGRRMPGTDVPIVSPEELVASNPDVVVLTLSDLQPELEESLPSLAGRWLPIERLGRALEPSTTGHRGFSESNRLQTRLHDLVPGGAHTYARGPDQYPDRMAPVLRDGRAARVWDVDGNCYVEYGMGLRSVTLGHAYPPVVEAAARAAGRGHNFSRPTVLEAEIAEKFLGVVSTADMVKFGKNGSDATTAGVRLARAVTGRDVVAVCRQPFFSVDDWFIGTTSMHAGIPKEVRSLTESFDYNDLGSLEAVFDRNPGSVACVVLEAATGTAEPAPGFLEGVRALCDESGALLLFDEIITGFRWAAAGAQSLYGVTPDLSSWGKALGNGYPISALAGRREYMEYGGLRTDHERAFLLSTTYGPETTALAAAGAVIDAYRTQDPVGRMERTGDALAEGFNRAAAEFGLSDHLEAIGRPSCAVFVTRDSEGVPSQSFRTLFLQEVITRGVLGQSFVVSAAHTERDVAHTLEASRCAMQVYREAIDHGSAEPFLAGRSVAPALRPHAHPRREP